MIFVLIFFGGHPYMPFEYLSKKAHVLIAAHHCNPFNTLFVEYKHFFCGFYPEPLQVFQRSVAGGLFKSTNKIPGAHIDDPRHFFQRDLSVVVLFQILLNPGYRIVGIRFLKMKVRVAGLWLLMHVDHKYLRSRDSNLPTEEFFDELDH